MLRSRCLSLSAKAMRPSKGRMFSVQKDLPHLPVPALSQTLDKYLKTVRPITTPDAYKETEQIVSQFAETDGPKLQELLVKHAQDKQNWLADWWLNCAYLDYREPNVINSNPGMVMPSQKFASDAEWLAYAAKFTRGALEYKRLITNEDLEVEVLGGHQLCMTQYYKVFSTCRVPDIKRDRLVCYPPNKPNAPRHMVVMHNNQFFSVDIYGSDGRLVNEKQLEKLLHKVVSRSQETGPGVGVLTTCNRNQWAKEHKSLAKLGNNARILDSIEKSIFILCLDGECSSTQDSGADERSKVARQMLYGDGSKCASTNRWFDKTIQFVIGRSGSVGLNYEHSPAEGPPMASLLDYIYFYCEKNPDNPPAKGTTEPEHLEFKLNKSLENAIELAKSEIDIWRSYAASEWETRDTINPIITKSLVPEKK